MNELKEIEIKKLSGSEIFQNGSNKLDFDLLSFWQWSSSDVVSNATRGILAGLAALLWFPWIFLLGFSLKGLKSFIPFIQNNWEDAIMLAFFVSFITSAISLFYILTKISKFDVFQKFIRNPRKASLEKCKLNLKNASIPDLGLEEITRLEKDIKKLETEKREYILSHEIKKSENIQSPENKECPMCAETVKAKAIICRFCNHKFEPDIIG